jgi:hypothetical protein
MRDRICEQPASEMEINSILQPGGPKKNKSRPDLLRRLWQSCYLDDKCNPLTPRQRLLAQYRKDGLVLFLGAGVSTCSGVPSWDNLIQKVFAQLDLGKFDLGKFDYETVKWSFPNLLTQFDLAAYTLGSQREFVKMLYDCLYGDARFKEIKNIITEKKSWTQQRWNKLLVQLQRNETLKAVGELLIVKTGENWRRNQQIHAVLTTNADNLLELYCQASAPRARLLTMVDRASVGDHPEMTPVYHLHGALDAREENILRDGTPCNEVAVADLQKIDDQLLPGLVFRESEYYETLASPISFVNHTPQSYFQRLNVLFIGTSLNDLNIRRWLHSSFRERVEARTKYLREYHYRKYCDVRVEAELESVRHFWLRTKTERHEKCGMVEEREVPMKLIELSMSKLGVQVVWCDSYEDMQGCIRKLKKASVPNFGRRPFVRGWRPSAG